MKTRDHRQPARRAGTLALLAALLGGCGGSPPALQAAAPDLGAHATAASGAFAAAPIAFTAGRGQARVESWRRPVLLTFGTGQPGKDFRATVAAAAAAGDAADQQAAPATGRNYRDCRLRSRPQADNIQNAGRRLPPAPAQPAQPVPVGTTRDFWLDLEGTHPGRWQQRSFRLAWAAPHTYVWVDEADAGRAEPAMLRKLGNYFETVAYPRDVAAFGDVPRGQEDVDNDEHVYLMITSETGDSSAYFNTVDMLPVGADEEKHSNRHKIVWIGRKWWGSGDLPALFATAIHEFQHLINFSQKGFLPARRGHAPLWEDAWLDEGLSVYAEQVGGFGLPGQELGTVEEVAHFLEEAPSTPVITGGDSDSVDYAAAYLFATYVADRFGPESVRRILTTPATGMKAVEAAAGLPFAEVFGDWGVALYASGLSSDPRFSFKSFSLRGRFAGRQLSGVVPPERVGRYPAKRELSGKAWSLQYLAFGGAADGGALSLEVKSPQQSQPAAVVFGEPRN